MCIKNNNNKKQTRTNKSYKQAKREYKNKKMS